MRIMLKDNGGRRSNKDRRRFKVSFQRFGISDQFIERRANKDRRTCLDRRADKYREEFDRDIPAHRVNNYKILGLG